MDLRTPWHCLFAVICLGHVVWSSSKDSALYNKHLKVVVVPWKPFLSWKCPTLPDYVDWWQIDKDYVDDWDAEEVYYAETQLDNSSSGGKGGCPNGEERMYSGILWELLMFMKQARNLTYTIVGIDDAWWGGTCHDSDNCTGMVGRVNRQEADIALGLYIIMWYELHKPRPIFFSHQKFHILTILLKV